MTRRVFRYEIAVSDGPQPLFVDGDPLHVAAVATRQVVEFWAEGLYEVARRDRRVFQVFDTGSDLPADAVWRGTCDRWDALGLVWHLYERMGDDR